jgi:hypothetical protein
MSMGIGHNMVNGIGEWRLEKRKGRKERTFPLKLASDRDLVGNAKRECDWEIDELQNAKKHSGH